MINFLFKFLAPFPFWFLHGLGVLIGVIAYALSSSLRRKMRDHIAAFATDDSWARTRMLWATAAHAGMALLELPFLWGRATNQGIGARVRLLNWGLIEQAQRQGKGILFLTPHLGCFEGTPQVFALEAPITVLYRPNRNNQVEGIIQKSRARSNIQIAPTSLAGVRLMLKALRRREAVGLLPDQVPPEGEGVWAPFFGRSAYTMTLPARLVRKTGCVLILALGIRRPFRGMTLELFEGPRDLSDNPVQAATQINQAIEKLIRLHPEQYYWAYERYKAPKRKKNSLFMKEF